MTEQEGIREGGDSWENVDRWMKRIAIGWLIAGAAAAGPVYLAMKDANAVGWVVIGALLLAGVFRFWKSFFIFG